MDDTEIRIDAMNSVNDLYNFDFEKAEREFGWLKQKYPKHPLPYFLFGLSKWWSMLPDFENGKNDEALIAYMDTVIEYCEDMFDKDENDIEATFFSAAAYGFLGRLHGERRHWRKAVYNGFKALKFIKEGEELGEFSYEFLFGSGIYYYYSVWIPENYPWVKPFLFFKTQGDKQKGINLLKTVCNMAFYTRTEAQYFLMRIYANEEEQPSLSYPYSEYLYNTFPNNSYFHRFYARLNFQTGNLTRAEELSLSMLTKLKEGKTGFCNTDGRYASYFLAYTYDYFKTDKQKAKYYYEQCFLYSELDKAFESRYYLKTMTRLARFADEEGDKEKAKKLYRKVLKYDEDESEFYKEADLYLKGKSKKVKVKR